MKLARSLAFWLWVFYILVFVWPTPFRYDHLGGTPVRWHRITGKVEFLNLEGWQDQLPMRKFPDAK